MVYTQEQLNILLLSLIDKFEDEVVEFKEATTNYSFKDIGKYFSDLSNEANLRFGNRIFFSSSRLSGCFLLLTYSCYP